MALLRQLRARLPLLQGSCSRLLSGQAQASASGMPEFFANSDLSQATSNIGLARRRDLTFRQDIRLTVDGVPRSLKELFKARAVLEAGRLGNTGS